MAGMLTSNYALLARPDSMWLTAEQAYTEHSLIVNVLRTVERYPCTKYARTDVVDTLQLRQGSVVGDNASQGEGYIARMYHFLN